MRWMNRYSSLLVWLPEVSHARFMREASYCCGEASLSRLAAFCRVRFLMFHNRPLTLSMGVSLRLWRRRCLASTLSGGCKISLCRRVATELILLNAR
jgi:hypothetical protein